MILRLCFLVVIGFSLIGCSSIPNLYSDAQLSTMALEQFEAMKQEMPVSRDRAMNAQVQRVGQRIAAVVEGEIPDAAWEFIVFENDSVNAFAMPGGKIGVNTGLLALVDSDDELAGVMGHEVCHVLLKHSNQRMSAELVRQGFGVGVQVASKDMKTENQALINAAYGIGTEIALMKPFGRSHEYEADERGLIVAATAGYDPRGSVVFWEKMKATSDGQPPEFLSTHPNHDNRIERLTALMPEAMAIYESARK